MLLPVPIVDVHHAMQGAPEVFKPFSFVFFQKLGINDYHMAKDEFLTVPIVDVYHGMQNVPEVLKPFAFVSFQKLGTMNYPKKQVFNLYQLRHCAYITYSVKT